mmetsp:Transcript_4927/g.14051  ORF Transcript_4927/g.14051 Transcript_4927/m.14051 type:complete len:95 (+) Transcript_4927:128-412(+)
MVDQPETGSVGKLEWVAEAESAVVVFVEHLCCEGCPHPPPPRGPVLKLKGRMSRGGLDIGEIPWLFGKRDIRVDEIGQLHCERVLASRKERKCI